MKKVNLYSLSDASDQSWVLDRALFLLSNSPVQLRMSQLSRTTGVPPSALTRMKNLHANPQYEPLVNKHMLFNVLRHVLEQFPTLVLSRAPDGNIQVRLFKTHAGHKLCPIPETAHDQLFKRNPPKPGTTRWFLEHLQEDSLRNNADQAGLSK